MSKRDRPKASQVFSEAQHLFAKKVTFFEAYPTIETAKVEITQSGENVYLGGKGVLENERIGEFYDCNNLMCYNGGVSIGEILRDMVANRQTEFEDDKPCQGYEGSPKGQRRYGLCHNRFLVKISLEY